MNRIEESRKLMGLGLCLLTLILVCLIATVAIGLFDAPESLFNTVVATIGALGIGHQGAQAAADRSPTYEALPPLDPPCDPPQGERGATKVGVAVVIDNENAAGHD